MRFFLFIVLLISPWGLGTIYAQGTQKADGVGGVQHVPHPPHDHHHDDHVKKLDESLKRSREEGEDKDSESIERD